MDFNQIIASLNAIFKAAGLAWESRKVTERDPSNGSDNVFLYIKFTDDEYSDFMTKDQSLNYLRYCSSVGFTNIQKPLISNHQEIPQPKKYTNHLRLVVDNVQTTQQIR